MTTKFEEIMLQEIFKLSEKIDKIQLEMKGMATKEDIKNMATKEDLIELEKRIEKKIDQKIDQKLEKQTQEIAEMFTDAFKLSSKYHRELEDRITKATDAKIENLRKEFICKKA